jgi:UDP-N-acetylglucosamine--N-acetylmuramyl-(pentapeptide) pyrophosphoryl-undecaprenol N-acetylglucosamine transferase
MRLLLAGGGTGGHLFPAVALAQLLLEQDTEAVVQFVGTAQGLGAKVLPQLGLPLETIEISGLVGKNLRYKLMLLPKLLRSVRQSLQIIDRFQPDVVVGVGGYASGPVALAAKKRGCPLVLHEQNAWPGLTNRILGRWADKICVTFKETRSAFNDKQTRVTGNPVRRELTSQMAPAEGPPTLLVFGGSRGARALNQAMIGTLPLLQDWQGRLQIIHQTGSDDLQSVTEGYQAAGWKDAEVVAFIDDMAAAYRRAHLVLCRAGATTIAELTSCGRPAILVPFPYAAGDHQSVNARSLAKRGAALMLPQSEMNPQNLASLLGNLLGDRERLLDMAGVARSLGKPEAASAILEECRRLAKKDRH